MRTSTLPPRTPAPADADPTVDPAAPDGPTPDKPVLTLSVTALVAGALAAITSAVVGSHLGTAGTLAGAAVGSVIGAVSTAFYTFGLQRTWHALSGLTPRRARLAAGVLLSALAAFLVALGAITGVETATGTSLAGQPGTTVEQVRVVTVERPTAADEAPVATEATESAGATPSPSPSSSAEVTATPSPTPEPTATDPVSPEPAAPSATTTDAASASAGPSTEADAGVPAE